MESTSLFNIYLEKQRKFIALVKEIQFTFNSKEYKEHGYSFKQYIKMKWNISQAQTYRYLMCARVIDQLNEFEIKPAYESLCKSLYNVTKNPLQMKLLWSVILQKTNNRPDCINSTHVNQYWKEICMDEKYADICNIEDETKTKSKMDKTSSKIPIDKKSKQIKRKTPVKQRRNSKTITVPSSVPIESSTFNIQTSIDNKPIIYSNDNIKYIRTNTLSPNFNSKNTIPNIKTSLYENSIPKSKNSLCKPSYSQYVPYTNQIIIPSTQTICFPSQNQFSYQPSLVPITTYFQ